MNEHDPKRKTSASRIHRWVRRAFLAWAVVSTLYLANTFRTRGVDPELLRSTATVTVRDLPERLEFVPGGPPPHPRPRTGLIFWCGSGVAARAYAPLLRPLADEGYVVAIVKLPYRLAPLETHKSAALDRARKAMSSHPDVARWVLAGHSLGGALACRFVRDEPASAQGLVLIGTTHPKRFDLSFLEIPVTKVLGTRDGVAPEAKAEANRSLLPPSTHWVRIKGGNHSQFGHYGHQILDGRASLGREAQQAATRRALEEVLASVAARPEAS